MKMHKIIAPLMLSVAGVGSASAGAIPYPNGGTPNPATYSFTAAVTGNVSAYFLGNGGASFSESLGLLVNGVDTGITGLPNQTTAIGTHLDFGTVAAGSTLVFYIKVENTGDTWYSNAALNSDGANHIYSTGYTGSDAPHGTYVGFEDLPAGASDFNYADEQYVFTNVASTPAVPEPQSYALMLAGLGFAVLMLRARQAN
jgi:hypothetical protein